MYKLIGTGNLSKILHTVLENRGVTDLATFLRPKKKHEIHYSKLKNMDKAVALFGKYSNYLIVTDRDADGFTSSATLQRYIEENLKEKAVSNVQHPKRQNGLTPYIMKYIQELEVKPDLVILPDASSNDIEQHKVLNALDIAVLVLDHHNVSKQVLDNEMTVVVNPQLSPDYENKAISGAGVVYKFLQALDDKYNIQQADRYLDLIALGNIADVMSMKHPDTRSMVVNGLKNINTSFLKALIMKNLDSERKLSILSMSWDVIPKLNGMIRFGALEEIQFVYEAMLGRTGTFENPRARSAKNKIETWDQKAVRLCTNATSRQKTFSKKAQQQLTEYISENNLDKYPVILLATDIVDTQGLTGYIAGNLTKIYQKPVVYFSGESEHKSGQYVGSLRGFDSVLKDTRSYLRDSGLMDFAEGHSQAAGVGINIAKLDKLYKYIEETEIKKDETDVAQVDFELEYDDLTNYLFQEMDDLEVYWGKDVEQPTFLIKNVKMDMDKFSIKENVSDITLESVQHPNITNKFTSFALPNELREIAAQGGKVVTADIIGTVGINRFARKVDNQVVVEEFINLRIEDAEDYFAFDCGDLFD